jgi:exosortase A-associated hydrolase 1
MRFDLRGMGDSDGDPPGFEASGPDIGAAVQALRAHCPGVRGVVLWGLCDGASAAVLGWQSAGAQHISGLCLVNPWVRTATVQASAQVQHYYRGRLRDPAFWHKLLAGGVRPVAISDWWRAWRRARLAPPHPGDFTDRMAAALKAFDGAVLVVLSGRDNTAREFEVLSNEGAAWHGLRDRPTWTRIDHPEADHTHGGKGAAAALEGDVTKWMQVNFGGHFTDGRSS